MVPVVQGPPEDDDLYVSALADCGLDERSVSTDWSIYRHATDSGVFQEVFSSQLGYDPSPSERAFFCAQYIQRLRRAIQERPTSIAEVRGAREMISRLRNTENLRIAVASGAWRDSVVLKLAQIHIDVNGLPSTYAETSIDRQVIIRAAVAEARTHFSCEFARIIYVGDRAWDAAAAAGLGMGFIGVGENWRESLRRTPRWIVDYADLDLFEALVHAT